MITIIHASRNICRANVPRTCSLFNTWFDRGIIRKKSFLDNYLGHCKFCTWEIHESTCLYLKPGFIVPLLIFFVKVHFLFTYLFTVTCSKSTTENIFYHSSTFLSLHYTTSLSITLFINILCGSRLLSSSLWQK